MGDIEELEKYKKLFDDGALSEEEFRMLKQKLLGLKTDESPCSPFPDSSPS